MSRATTLAIVLVAAASLCGWADEKKFGFVDFKSKANVKLTDDFHADNPGNNLADLPRGEQKFADVKFKIGESCLQLGSASLKENGRDFPTKFEGIEVGKVFSKLHILHAMGYGTTFEANPELLPKDKVIAKFTVHYEDDSKEAIPIVYGEDVCDWWFAPQSEFHKREPSKAKVAWAGKNDVLRDAPDDVKIRLYLTTWENPRPAKKVVRLDYSATAPDGPAAPFCVALSVEGK